QFLFWNEYRGGSIYKLDQCQNNRCIPLRWLCDGDNDCGNDEDESNTTCSARTCPPNQYPCASGRCIPISWTCDLDDDCGDRSDEPDSCAYPTCFPLTQFTCANGRCININWRCDNDNDCGDSSDEAGCSHSCSSVQFKCNSGRCIPEYWTCDGDNDCGDYSDETHANCTNQAMCVIVIWVGSESGCHPASQDTYTITNDCNGLFFLISVFFAFVFWASVCAVFVAVSCGFCFVRV
uniref:Uncharacterized protein n=1 Tax=Neolamprologus brichardi TaxID=32507 RepID=A0A3Q4HML6_NEOBR